MKTVKKPDPASDIKSVRADIAKLQFQQKVIHSQTRNRAEVEALLEKTLLEFEVQATHDVLRTVSQLAASEPASIFTVTAETSNGPISIKLGPLFAGLLGTASLIKTMRTALQALPEGLTPEAKARELAALDYELDNLQISEEILIRESDESGTLISRRGDADPKYSLARYLSPVSRELAE